MKRSKFLFPTLACLTVAPAIVSLSSCNSKNVEQEIIDAVMNPYDLDKSALPQSTLKASFDKLSSNEKKNEILFDTFGLFNVVVVDKDSSKTIHDLYKTEGGFKVNVTKCEVTKDGENYYATLLGYISYVFSKQHKATIDGTDMTFNANDYIMVTFDFKNIKVNLDDTNYSISLTETSPFCLGFYKYRYHNYDVQEEKLSQILTCNTSTWKVKNSKNWDPNPEINN